MNNVQLIMAAIAFASLLMTILGGAWINQRGLEKQMEAFRQEMRAEFAAIRAEIQAEARTTRSEFQALNQRVERIERQLDAIFKPALPKASD